MPGRLPIRGLPMHSSPDISLERRLPFRQGSQEALVQDRPTLGAMSQGRRGPAVWLIPLIDLLVASLALAIAASAAGVAFFPAFPLAPLALFAAEAALGAYASSAAGVEEDRATNQ